jgi:hypothetical protein
MLLCCRKGGLCVRGTGSSWEGFSLLPLSVTERLGIIVLPPLVLLWSVVSWAILL